MVRYKLFVYKSVFYLFLMIASAVAQILSLDVFTLHDRVFNVEIKEDDTYRSPERKLIAKLFQHKTPDLPQK